MNFGARLAKIRDDAKLSQSALAKAVGTSQSAISQIESGERLPSFEMIRQLASALGQSPAYLFGDEVELSADERVLFRQYRSLPETAKKELEDFASWLRVKHAKREK